MKKLIEITALFIVFLCANPVFAQYSNASLNGPWYGLNFDPDAYMIFDGNGNVNEFGVYGGVTNSNIGTYYVSPIGDLSVSLSVGGETFNLNGQFITADSISFKDNIHYLLKIPDAGALSDTWSGGITNSSYGSLIVTADISGLITSPNTWLGHMFVRNGKVVGFFETQDGSECWHQIQLVNCVYSNNTITGTVTSDCKDLPGSIIILSRTSLNKTVDIIAGSLSTTLSVIEKNETAKLTVTGTIDARDFKTMRDDMPLLAEIDLSGATVVAYSGLDGTNTAISTDYPANTIPLRAFYNSITLIGKKSLTSFIFPASISLIGKAAFRDCTSLNAISIPSSVTTIGDQAFLNCNDLTSVSFGPSSLLTKIGAWAFAWCNQLTSFYISPLVTSIGDIAFTGSSAFITVSADNSSFICPEGVLIDKNMARLMYCPSFKTGDYAIPSSVQTIAVDAFFYCQGITSISIPASVTTIEDWAFENCNGLALITIPSSVTTIKGYAFYRCSNLTSIYANSIIPVNLSASDSVFNYVNKTTCTLYVPTGSKAAYQAADKWKDFSNIVEFSLEIENGLVAYYPFNGNANDESGNANDGTVFGATLTQDRFGNLNSAYSFDGLNSYIAIDGIIDNLYSTNSYSATGWIKLNSLQKGSIFSMNRETEIVNGQNISIVLWEGLQLLYFGDYMTNNVYSHPEINTNNWHFFAFTLDKSSTGRLSVDNQVICQEFSNNTEITLTSKASIGQEWDNGFNGSSYFSITSDFFNGQIDDIRIYNRILNQQEIQFLFDELITGMPIIRAGDYNIYPNPAIDHITIENPGQAVIEIFNIQGKLMKKIYEDGQRTNIDVSSFPKGVYILNVKTGTSVSGTKFVKK